MAAYSTQPALGQQRDEDNRGKLDTKPRGGSSLGTSDPIHSSTVSSTTAGQYENTASSSGGFRDEGGNTGAAGYSTYMANKLDARDDSQRDESTALGDNSSTLPSDTGDLVNPTEAKRSALDTRDDSQRDASTRLGDQSSTHHSYTTNLAASTDNRSYGQSDHSAGTYGSTSRGDKLDEPVHLPRGEPTTLGGNSSALPTYTSNVVNPMETESSALNVRDDSQHDVPTRLGDQSSTPHSHTTNLAASTDDRSYGQSDHSAVTYGSTSMGNKLDAPVDLPREEPTALGGSSSALPSDTSNVVNLMEIERSTLDARGDSQRDVLTRLGDHSSTLPSHTINLAASTNKMSYGQSDYSTGIYGSTSMGDKLDGPVDLPREEPTTLGGNSSTLPSGSYNPTNSSDTQGEYMTGSAKTTTQSSTLQGSDDHRASSTIGGDTSDRLPGQSDTSFGPSGGIAEGGMPQGRNVMGDVRPEHETEKTGVTGIHNNDPKMTQEFPSSSNEPSAAPGGQSRAPAGGFGVAEPSVGADPSSGQKPMQKQQGADRPVEEPSGENEQAIREKKEATEKAAEKKDRSGQPLGGQENQGEKGTGEKWVKSTGFAADGGDFDAAKPGAGKEADRKITATNP